MMKNDIENKIIQERLKNTRCSFQHPSFLLEQRMIRAVTAADQSVALATLDQINSLERAELSDNPLRSIKNSLIGSCTIFTRACIAGGVESETAFMLSDLYIRQIEMLENRVQAESLEYDMIIGFVDLVRERHMPKYSPPVRKAYQFICEHAQFRLSLADIAGHAGVHPNYLCGLFKSEVGSSMMDVYDYERSEAIKQFLSHTDISLTDISVNFDFSSVSYFSSYFRKQTGQSPSEYRRQCQII